MARNRLLWVTVIYLAAGCSRPESIPTAAGTAIKPSTISAGLPSLPGDSSVATGPKKGPNDAETRSIALRPPAAAAPPSLPAMDDLFAPPKVVVPVVTREPEVQPQVRPAETPPAQPEKKPLPQLRLVGFVEMEGLAALLAIEGKLNALTIGDAPEGLQILAIEPPAVTLRQGDDGEEFQLNLYEQPWFHQPGAQRKKPGGKSIIPPAPTSGRGLTAATSGTTQANATPAAGFGPSLSAPGLQGPPGAGLPPGMPGLPAFGAPSSPSGTQEKGQKKNAAAGSKAGPANPALPGLPAGLPATPPSR
jgi:hypothetical protein